MAFKDYLSPRALSILFLGFASGLPLALCGSNLQIWYTEAGASLIAIGFLTWLGQPYVFKFLWAPLLDRYTLPVLSQYLGRRRSWMLVFQILIIFTITSMAFLNPTEQPWGLALMGLVLAIFSSSQDIAIGAYQTDIPRTHEKGLVAAGYNIGWRIGYLTSGAFALVIAQYYGWKWTYLSMAGFMVIGVFTSLLSPTPDTDTIPREHVSILKSFAEPWRDFFQRHTVKIAILLLLIMMFYKLNDALAMSLNSTFMIRALHFTKVDIALANKTVSVWASIAGTIAGGFFMVRLNLFRALMLFGVLQALSNLPFMCLAIVGHNYPLLMLSVFSENFVAGLSTTAFVAFMMSLCNKKYSATQFAILSAFPAVGRVYIGPLAALMVDAMGWPMFYLSTVFVAIPSLILLYLLRDKLKQY